jgi:hypothetical protein
MIVIRGGYGVVTSLPWPRSTLVEQTQTAIPTNKTINSGEFLELHQNFITAYVPAKQTEYELHLSSKIYNVYFQQIYTVSNL